MKKLMIILTILFFLSSMISAFFFFNSGVFDFNAGHVTNDSITPVIQNLNQIRFINIKIPVDSEECFNCIPKN